MVKATKLIIDPKKWLGDNKILKMDWDVKAMHFHLMLLAWQNEPQGCIEVKDLGKYLALDMQSEDWRQRISPQLLTVWQKKTLKNHLDQEVDFYVQSGLLKEIEKQSKPTTTRTKKAAITAKKQDNTTPEQDGEQGFVLLDVLHESVEIKEEITQQQQKENSITIWTIGVDLLRDEHFSAPRARAFLAKLAKEYGSIELAGAIAQMNLKKNTPVDAKSYLVSILKNGVNTKPKFTNFSNQKIHHNQASGKLIL